jgi:acyl-CoA dehydrogenase
MMSQASPLRERLSKNVYVGKSSEDSLGRLVNAFNKVVAAEPLEAKVTQGIRDKIIHRVANAKELLQSAVSAALITHAEMDQIVEARAACQDAMEVDSFEPEYLLTRMSKHGVK